MPSNELRCLVLGLISTCLLALGHSRTSAAEKPNTAPSSHNASNSAFVDEPIPEKPDSSPTSAPSAMSVISPEPDGLSASIGQDASVPPCGANAGTCHDPGGLCEDACEPCGYFWFRGDYLLWWTKGARVPPLVTTSLPNTPVGVLGESTTSILFGDSRVLDDGRSSFRVTLGYWFNCCQTHGIQADYFDLGSERDDFAAQSFGEPILARPFFDVVNQVQSAQIVAVPGIAMGDVSVRTSDYFESAGALLRLNLCCLEDECADGCSACVDCDADCVDYPCGTPRRFRLDLIGGYRFYDYGDRVRVHETVISIDPGGVVPIGTTFDITDSFRSSNEFHGGDLGLITQVGRGRWSLEFLTKMAMGNNHRLVTVNGTTNTTIPGEPTVTQVGGLLGLPTNIGQYRHDSFVIIPQFGVELGYQWGCRTKLTFGYNFLYWARVARSGDQIDLGINPTQIPPGQLVGPARPAFQLRDSDLWAQGINAGLEFRF